MGVTHLAVIILQEIGLVALGDADAGIFGAQARSVQAAIESLATGLDSHQLYRILHESGKQPHGVGAAADTGIDAFRQATLASENLFARLGADDGLEPGDHFRKRMRAAGSAEYIMGGVHIGYPVAERLVDSVLEGT